MTNTHIGLLLEQRNRIESILNHHATMLNKLQNGNGLIPDEFKETEYYTYHKTEMDKHMKMLQDFNSGLSKNEKKEMVALKRKQKSKRKALQR